MKTPHELVWEFHEAFDTPRSDVPKLPTKALRDARKKFLSEEFEEYLQGEKNDDLVNIAQELADMVYIIYGTSIAYGIPLDEVITEVHRANMSKLGPDGKALRREDGKAIKGPNFKPADVKSIIEKHQSK